MELSKFKKRCLNGFYRIQPLEIDGYNVENISQEKTSVTYYQKQIVIKKSYLSRM